MWVHTARHEHLLPIRTESSRHQDSLGERRRAIVHTGVRHIESQQQRRERLELENRLQRPLADLRLIRRVGGRELRAEENLVHHRRSHVCVGAGTKEHRVGIDGGAPCRGIRHGAPQGRLGQARRQVDPGAAPQRLGHMVHQCLDRILADDCEHRSDVVCGVGGVRAHACSCSTCAR